MSDTARSRETEILNLLDFDDVDAIDDRIHSLIDRNRQIHDYDCINLNPASNVMNPRAEKALSCGLTTRASLGHPGEKYEMGLEAIEEIEVIAAELARAVFGSAHVELRVPSGAIANLYAFMATCEPGDAILVPSPDIGGHVTHRHGGAAGLYRLDIHEYPSDPTTFSADLAGLAKLAEQVKPKLITIGTSLNLVAHPVEAIREIADSTGAFVLFDAAHACGMFAGGVWSNPLDNGADLMTMSTYKSLGGPAGGIVATNRDDLAAKIDAIAYPGLTANFDVSVTTALAITLLDWKTVGAKYAAMMVANAQALAAELERRGVPVFKTSSGHTTSHQFAIDATRWGGGDEAARYLARANLLTSAIGLPGDVSSGLRFGTPEITRIGMVPDDMRRLAQLIADAFLSTPESVACSVSEFRRRFDSVHFVRH